MFLLLGSLHFSKGIVVNKSRHSGKSGGTSAEGKILLDEPEVQPCKLPDVRLQEGPCQGGRAARPGRGRSARHQEQEWAEARGGDTGQRNSRAAQGRALEESSLRGLESQRTWKGFQEFSTLFLQVGREAELLEQQERNEVEVFFKFLAVI